MKVVRFRVIIFLSVIYLGLVSLLYHFLWRTHALDGLFDSPGHQPPQTDNEFVQFNFKRVNAPHLLPNTAAGNGSIVHSLNKSAPISPSGLGNNESRAVLSRSHTLTVPSEPKSSENGTSNLTTFGLPNYCLHAFYYPWYGNKEFDGRYIHWNHRYIRHWDPNVAKRYPDGRHTPPDDIGASFYPKLGPYSSTDTSTIETHMQQLRQAGIGVISVSWYPPKLADTEGIPLDSLIPVILDIAQKYAVKVTLHIEPYEKRTPMTIGKDLEYIHRKYSDHPAFYKMMKVGDVKRQPLVYIYDSYNSPANEWSQVFKPGGTNTIRGKEHDCVAIALLVQQSHKKFVLEGGFDGFYTYFASNGFTFGSSMNNWRTLAVFAKENDLIFIPSFGPGYEDTQVRPWNSKTTKQRKDGAYYREMFKSAVMNNNGGLLSITSFNEWHEGTQIEPAVPKKSEYFTYIDYSPHSPEYYLELTQGFSQQLECSHV